MSIDPVSRPTLRPLMSRPFSTFSTTPTHCFSLHNPKLNPWSQALSDYGGKSRGAPLVSSRWNPTPEQVQALEEMYRRGTRTPTAEQIQQIVAKLRRFGKIEGKNVFYWFQNHKARDRQKKRRQLELLAANDVPTNQIPKQSGLRRKYLESDEHPKKPATMSKCSTVSEIVHPRGVLVEECKRDGWTQLELQQQSVAANTTTMQLDLSSSCISPNVSLHTITTHGQENAYPFMTLSSKLPTRKKDNFSSGVKENRTLELFPVRSNGMSLSSLICSTKEDMNDVSSAVTKLVPNQFFEFLPTKN